MSWPCEIAVGHETDRAGKPVVKTCGAPGALRRVAGAFADVVMCDEHAERWRARKVEQKK